VSGGRRETTTAMADTVVQPIPCTEFLLRLSRDALLEGFVRYLAGRLADQQRVIANLVTVDSEQRLAQTLLYLAHQLGQHDPPSIRIVPKIFHAELAEMVGTTRPRISTFMKRFRDRGPIERTTDHQLIIKEQRLTAYVARVHSSDGPDRYLTQQIFLIESYIEQTSLLRCATLRLQYILNAVLARFGQGAGD
jgi:CRP/FNR family cyclic AMP-dependent transcriptional regulator